MHTILKLALSISLVGFLGISLLLLLGHPGFALRVGNYLFFFLLMTGLLGFTKNEK